MVSVNSSAREIAIGMQATISTSKQRGSQYFIALLLYPSSARGSNKMSVDWLSYGEADKIQRSGKLFWLSDYIMLSACQVFAGSLYGYFAYLSR